MRPDPRANTALRVRRLALVAGFALLAPGASFAQPPGGAPKAGRQEEARRKLLEQMGLEKKGSAPPAPAPTAPAAPPPSQSGSQAPAEGSPTLAPAVNPVPPSNRRVSASSFSSGAHEVLLKSCRSCHSAAGMAATTRFVLSGQATQDHVASRAFVDTTAPARSVLLTKATAALAHGGGPTLAASSESYQRLVNWITAGAQLEARGAEIPAAAARTSPAPSSHQGVKPSGSLGLPPPAPTPLAPTGAADAAGETTGVAAAAPAVAAEPSASFSAEALAFHDELGRACLSCHRQGGPAAMTRYLLDGTLEADLQASRRFVDPSQPQASPLLAKASGQAHGGGAVWSAGSAGAHALTAWLNAGAPVSTPLATPAVPALPVAAPVGPLPGAGLPKAGTSAPTAPAPDATSGATPRFALLGREFSLNGRFDVNFERRGFATNPLSGGTAAIQSYHHFVFLGRQSTADPFTFTAELTSLLFYEAGVRLVPARRKRGVHLRVGKLLVPFGNEPLFHQSYGGHVGFDQRVLPAVWASEGIAATGHLDIGVVTLTSDLYAVRGHGLRRADAILNLQSDLSPVEDTQVAAGLRLGGALGPLAGFYSAYFNPLGHGRRLLMQALDLSLWRWRRLALVDRLVLGVGLLRADVSGGGAGVDYYHFASYWLARLYARDWLWLQYRQGLRAFDNRRGLVFDQRRNGPGDGSTHNFAVVARARGLSVSLSYFLNFEKVNEVDDDLLRLAVAYEF